MRGLYKDLDKSWTKILKPEFNADYYQNLLEFVKQERKKTTVYPKITDIFRAFKTTPFESIKVVIIGQDPYHGEGQAHGLSFSVEDGIKLPPSLKNIFKELHADVGCTIPENGNLYKWAEQGVLLLNSVLTVEKSKPGSHRNQGWETFTDNIIKKISEKRSNIVFLLWGNYAIEKENLIDSQKHCILKAPHPSPFSAYQGFFGCKHFSKTNEYLEKGGMNEINWEL
jgi:uracil-DNA glycosylase